MARLETQLDDLTPEMLTRSAWEREHCVELDRLDSLDRQITFAEGVERLIARELQRGVERDLGRGLEL